eukprot:TRINITY_DN38294_c0_g1_i1.p1 TRINITY_DN38294_c0_g1~~TRINITY_DN38294_c0_g1_i1.p1  ORF type:complete len:412 (-),score=37.34 TRINITY_DN38294_c0_g1_i1:128-1363(-)
MPRFGFILILVYDFHLATSLFYQSGHSLDSRDKFDVAKRDRFDTSLETGSDLDSRFDTEMSSGFYTRERGPWNKPKLFAVDSRTRNLCSSGKQLPDLYVIGQQKCGTSSIARDLMDAGVHNVHGPHNPKEFHWFNNNMRMNYTLEGPVALNRNREAWESWMPPCPGNGTSDAQRQVLADFTPAYSSVVPRPPNMVPVGPWVRVFDQAINIPLEMVKLHGDEAAKKLTLIMMIREPLSQMQSAWYHSRSFNFTNVCSSCRAPTFKDALFQLHNGTQQSPPQYTQWLWNVMYGQHLQEWVKHFDAAQLYIIPTHVYSKGDTKAICRDLSSRLDWAMECETQRNVSHEWTHQHPRLDQDAPQETLQYFHDLLSQDMQLLTKLLAEGNAKGMGLANYAGAPGDEKAISEWLKAGW